MKARTEITTTPARSNGSAWKERNRGPGSLYAGYRVLSVCTEDKATSDTPLDASLLVDNQEIARLLQEVSSIPGAALGNPPHAQPLTDLLMRAVRCAIKQYMLQAELRNLALTDELTGLHNRRGFLALGEQQLKLARRSGRGVFLFFADLDELKQMNDSFGHLEGDLALVRTAEILRETFRESDVIARVGGDEFAILAIEASDRSEAAIRNRLQKNLKRCNAQGSRSILSLSLGVVRFDPRRPTSIRQLMAEADHAMYEQKRRGPSAWLHLPCAG